jgi:hypothetical protein
MAVAAKRRDADVDAWFARSTHPLLDAMQSVREVFLSDARVTECIKWRSPTFVYEGNIASIDPHAKQHVTVLFHRGAEIPGKHPLLAGGGGTARYARFADRKTVLAERAALRGIVRAWCDWKDGAKMSARASRAKGTPKKR